MAKVVKMYGEQVKRFASIHPIKNGMYFYRVKQVQRWAAYWDDLHDSIDKQNQMIRCGTTVSDLGDAGYYMHSLMAHIVDGSGELELIIEQNKFGIVKSLAEGYAYEVRYYVHNSHNWIHQGHHYRFTNLFEMLDVIFGVIGEPYWNDLPSKYLKSMQEN